MSQDLTAVVIPAVFGLIFALIGLGLLAFARFQQASARQAQRWPTLSGTIVSSRIESQTTTEYDEGRSYSRTTHRPLVEYTYELFGKAYRGNRIFPGAPMRYDLGAAQAILSRYPVGRQVSIYYDPADPGHAVLETKVGGGSLLLIIGAIFAVLGVVACVLAGVVAVFR